MRNRTLILVLAIICANFEFLPAQTTKGKFLLAEMSSIDILGTGAQSTTNLGFTTYRGKSDSGDEGEPIKAFSINLIPRVGYFVVDNLAVGLDFDIDYYRSKRQGGDYVFKSTQFTTGPFLRYYVPTPKFLPYAEVNYSRGIGGYKVTSDNYEDEYNKQVQQYGFGIGMGLSLGDKVSFDMLIGYQSYIQKEKQDNDNNARDISSTVGLRLGLTVFL